MRKFTLFTGVGLLIFLEVARVYFIMPFPGSQEKNMLIISYWLDQNISWLRLILVVMFSYETWRNYSIFNIWWKVVLSVMLLIYCVVFYFFNFRFLAARMFYQPKIVQFSGSADNRVGQDKLVIGLMLNGKAKAYPIQLIGYHHQVRDKVGGEDVMVTYCTVCRTGRVYRPVVKGKVEDFRLVGMDQFNALFEDASTKSWWRQATGEAVAGPLKGVKLAEIPVQQMTLQAWVSLHPNTMILQPDPNFQKEYDHLAYYDKGLIKSTLEYRDTTSWKKKSWVVGISHDGVSKAYDWNNLFQKKLVTDSLPGLPLLVVMEKDGETFHTWNRKLGNRVLNFQLGTSTNEMIETNSGSMWSFNGTCIAGSMKGAKLELVQSYQEFWHSWKTFHPNTQRY